MAGRLGDCRGLPCAQRVPAPPASVLPPLMLGPGPALAAHLSPAALLSLSPRSLSPLLPLPLCSLFPCLPWLGPESEGRVCARPARGIGAAWALRIFRFWYSSVGSWASACITRARRGWCGARRPLHFSPSPPFPACWGPGAAVPPGPPAPQARRMWLDQALRAADDGALLFWARSPSRLCAFCGRVLRGGIWPALRGFVRPPPCRFPA